MFEPLYTFRCRVLEFKASKSQKKILKRFNKFLSGKEMISNDRKMSTSSSAPDDMGEHGVEQFVESTVTPQDIDVNDVMTTDETQESLEIDTEGSTL